MPLSLGSSFSLGPWSLLFTGELFRVELSSLETSGLSAVLTGDLSWCGGSASASALGVDTGDTSLIESALAFSSR